MNAISQAANSASRLKLMIRQVAYEAVGVRSYELVDPTGEDLPPVTPGSHIDLHLEDGTVRQYSLCNDPSERHRYVIAVLKEEWGRGGSKAVHQNFHVEHTVDVGVPRNSFALDPQATKHILIAGGIGVTPLKAMAHQLQANGADYELHYCAKTPAHAAFSRELLDRLDSDMVSLHFDGGNPVDGLNITDLLHEQPDGAHLYYCGPEGFMAACDKAASHWRPGTVHFEHFKAPSPSKSVVDSALSPVAQPGEAEFSIQIASTGLVFEVPENRTIAQVLADANIPIETSCEAGLCGACKIGYVEGEVDHRDFILSDEEHQGCLTACISRAKTPLLVLDL
ncbi:2Fe-2S iron-sulfur cluster-binding protein [Caballeronia sp. S22]|uniref:PDR/VanB family oxidoreductase n=1 Tax=Caballeronia sp. S22 TaxID=3137182 RepID=UPI003531735A